MNRISYDTFAGVIDTMGIEDIIFDLFRYEIEKLPPDAIIDSLTSKPGNIFSRGLVYTGEEYSEIEEIKNRLRNKFVKEYEEKDNIKKTIDGFNLMMFCRLHEGSGLSSYGTVFLGGDLMSFPSNKSINFFSIAIDVASKFLDKGMLKETIVEDLKQDYNILHRILAHEAVHIIQRIYTMGKGESYYKSRIKDEKEKVEYINKPSEIEAYARSVIEELKEMGFETLEEMRGNLTESWSYNFVKEHISRENFKTFVNKIYFLMKKHFEEV